MINFHSVTFCPVAVFFQTVLPRSGGLSPGQGWDAVTKPSSRALVAYHLGRGEMPLPNRPLALWWLITWAGVRCRYMMRLRSQLLKIKGSFSSVWAKGCMFGNAFVIWPDMTTPPVLSYIHYSLIYFLCGIVLFHFCCCNAQLFGKRSCMSSKFSIAIPNGTCFFSWN